MLIVFDDLSKQAEAYRAVSLLLRRPPGREAYPGDVFYLHSRLLERCAKLSDELGGGSMTGLPIIETKANDVSAYIPTNVISITDGQCFLESDLFNSGVRPAINVGISVSRVGGSAQPKAMRKVAGRLRLDLAQFRELEAFAAFGSDLDAASKAQIAARVRAGGAAQAAAVPPFPMEHEVVSVWAGTTGKLDEVPVEDIRRFETEFLDFLKSDKSAILDAIRETKDLSDDTVKTLEDAINAFKGRFTHHRGQPAGQRGAGGGAGGGRGRADHDHQARPGLTDGCPAAGLPTTDHAPSRRPRRSPRRWSSSRRPASSRPSSGWRRHGRTPASSSARSRRRLRAATPSTR